MIVVTGGRRSGKTSAICRWLAEAPIRRGVLVLNEERRRYILNRLRDAYPNLPHELQECVLTIRDVYGQSGRGRLSFPEMAIDDAEEVLKALLGTNVEFMAMTATWIPLATNPDPIKAEVINKELLGTVLRDALGWPKLKGR